jgi:hypothetical protein
MKKLILAAALTTALAACNNAAEDSPEPAAEETTSAAATETPAATESASTAAGTYEYTLDGKQTTTVLMADGMYTDTQDGKVVEKGMWAEHDDKLCFDPEGDDTLGTCFTSTDPDANGMFTATSDDGATVLKVKKTA